MKNLFEMRILCPQSECIQLNSAMRWDVFNTPLPQLHRMPLSTLWTAVESEMKMQREKYEKEKKTTRKIHMEWWCPGDRRIITWHNSIKEMQFECSSQLIISLRNANDDLCVKYELREDRSIARWWSMAASSPVCLEYSFQLTNSGRLLVCLFGLFHPWTCIRSQSVRDNGLRADAIANMCRDLVSSSLVETTNATAAGARQPEHKSGLCGQGRRRTVVRVLFSSANIGITRNWSRAMANIIKGRWSFNRQREECGMMMALAEEQEEGVPRVNKIIAKQCLL